MMMSFSYVIEMRNLFVLSAELNNNNRGIFLSFEASPEVIHFLDLEISVEDYKLTTSTYFKSTGWNSLI